MTPSPAPLCVPPPGNDSNDTALILRNNSHGMLVNVKFLIEFVGGREYKERDNDTTQDEDSK